MAVSSHVSSAIPRIGQRVAGVRIALIVIIKFHLKFCETWPNFLDFQMLMQ